MSAATKKGGEKSLLGVTKKSYGRSYGSTKKSTQPQDIYIKHIVTPSDTLAGISLKYSVSVEQIKRANKLYTSDGIFSRPTLSIPVGDQPLPAHVLENATSRANGSPIHKVAADVMVDSSGEEENGAGEEDKKDEGDVPEDNRDVQMDFFNRIDRQLRERKTNMDIIETTSSISEIEAASPNVQSSPTKQSTQRASKTSGACVDNSYQTGTVTVNTDTSRRKGNDLNQITRGGTSKGKDDKVALVSVDEKDILTGGSSSGKNQEKPSVRLV